MLDSKVEVSGETGENGWSMGARAHLEISIDQETKFMEVGVCRKFVYSKPRYYCSLNEIEAEVICYESEFT